MPHKLSEIASDKPVITFCGNGRRTIIAASIPKRHGFEHVENSPGSVAACAATGGPIES